jgi:hypothetical protein
MDSFEVIRESDRPPDVLLHEIVTNFSSGMASANYKLQNVLESGSDRIVTFTRTYRPGPIWVFGLILIPLLFLTNTAIVTVVLAPTDGDGTRIQITGDGERSLRRSIEEIEY